LSLLPINFVHHVSYAWNVIIGSGSDQLLTVENNVLPNVYSCVLLLILEVIPSLRFAVISLFVILMWIVCFLTGASVFFVQ